MQLLIIIPRVPLRCAIVVSFLHCVKETFDVDLLLLCGRDVDGNVIPRCNGNPMGFPWEWEWE